MDNSSDQRITKPQSRPGQAAFAVPAESMQSLREFLYAPNQLTLLRLVFIPPVILFILYSHYEAAFILGLIAGASDGLDGLLARRLGQQTTLGRYLDPIADKLLLSSSFVALGFMRKIPLWLVILVLSRDVIILMTVLVMLLATPLRAFPPSVYGKANTAAQIGTILLTLLALIYHLPVLWRLALAGVYCTAVFTVISGLHYAAVTAARLRHMEKTS